MVEHVRLSTNGRIGGLQIGDARHDYHLPESKTTAHLGIAIADLAGVDRTALKRAVRLLNEGKCRVPSKTRAVLGTASVGSELPTATSSYASMLCCSPLGGSFNSTHTARVRLSRADDLAAADDLAQEHPVRVRHQSNPHALAESNEGHVARTGNLAPRRGKDRESRRGFRLP